MTSHRLRMIRAKLEAEYGVDPVIAAADSLLVHGLSMKQLEGDQQAREFATGMEGAQVEDLYNAHCAAEFSVDAASGGAAGTAPKYGFLLKACGMSETVAAGVSVSYSPTPQGTDQGSIAFQMRGGTQLQKVLGSRGSFSFSAEKNRKPVFQFGFKGAYGVPTAPDANDVDFSAWPQALECSPANMQALTLGGTTLCVTSFSFSDGRNPVLGRYMNCAEVQNDPRKFTGRMTVKWPDLATKDILTQAKDAVLEPLVFTLGSVAGRILTVAAPAVQIKFAGEQNIDGDIGANLDMVFTPDQGDDELALSFS